MINMRNLPHFEKLRQDKKIAKEVVIKKKESLRED